MSADMTTKQRIEAAINRPLTEKELKTHIIEVSVMALLFGFASYTMWTVLPELNNQVVGGLIRPAQNFAIIHYFFTGVLVLVAITESFFALVTLDYWKSGEWRKGNATAPMETETAERETR
jgi:hypothetical protein